PGLTGLELLAAVKEDRPETEVIVVTGYGTVESAIDALKYGAYDYLQKPIELERLKILIDRIIEKKKLQRENLLIKQRLKERYKYDELVGVSPRMQRVYEIIDKISLGNSPTVLVQGESGTGKEVVAKIIHRNSERRDKPYIPVNCGAVPEGLLESELFGHVKGAFTGAIRDKEGLFQAADGGSIFLDEIAEIPTSLQVKLLRVLQEKKIRPVGGTREIEVDARVIAATNKNLESAIKNGTFRKDLFYRLNIVTIKMPALAEHTEDIPLLTDHFLKMFNETSKNKIRDVTKDVIDVLKSYNWPGNVRQLKNVVERAFALGVEGALDISDIPSEIRRATEDVVKENTVLNLKENEIILIKKALRQTDGNKARAAELLGINITTLYRKIAKYDIAPGGGNG
ncbi:MAG: sigma-54-dependent Fis family transcriptional regulator, partial [Desulfobacterales bacterium]|nr:sigma-54-dependent Fis family transcriptional regulator [Desulfobacterales bacterium]